MDAPGNKRDSIHDISLHIDDIGAKNPHIVFHDLSSHLVELRKLIKSLGFYALASIVTPLVSLILAPFLTHTLSISDYGVLMLLNTIISLGAGITQLGLGSAFFRAYNYDYAGSDDRRSVVSTATMLLLIVSLLTVLGTSSAATFLADLLLGHSSLGGLIAIGGVVIFVQNLTIPSFSWLRAENRPFLYSLLSVGNLLITVLANIVLVGVMHKGIAGSLIAGGGGYFCVVICTIPFIVYSAGIKIRRDIAQNLLGFGVPLVLNVVSYWVLQLSDRYLLSCFSSLTETAKYSVSYSVGSAIAAVVIAPFTLAWPATMYAIAKTREAARTFQLVFRWLSLFLLFAAFGLSFMGVLVLNVFFPVAYRSVSYIIPIISTSNVFFGIYNVFMIGINLKRKTWLGGVFMMIAATSNVFINLVLIPRYGALGAALSTLMAFILLTLTAYVVNQKIYPIAFEVGHFVFALLLGAALYSGSSSIAQGQGLYKASGIYIGALVLYAVCLIIIGILPTWKRKLDHRYDPTIKDRRSITNIFLPLKSLMRKSPTTKSSLIHVCMHVRGTVRTDERVLREAATLTEQGFLVTIVDIESDQRRLAEEDIGAIHIKHIMKPHWLIPTRGLKRLVRSAEKFIYSTACILRIPGDIYHAHDVNALPSCYIIAIMRRKKLVFDAHELPLSSLDDRRLPHFYVLMVGLLRVILSRCSGVITVSPPIAQEISDRYRASNVRLVRNILAYQPIRKSNRLRQYLNLAPEVQIVLYQGNLQADRGLTNLVRAAAFLKQNTIMVLMGRGVGETLSELEALIAYEGVADRVKILPSVSYAELLSWTSSADIGLIIYPSHSSNIKMCLPNKLFEYIMAGLPVLASPLDAVEDILMKYDVGQIVPSLAPSDIGAAINAMLADSVSHMRMHRNALEIAKHELCWEKERQHLIRLYQSIFDFKST